GLGLELADAERDQGASPIEGLGDAGRLLEVEPPKLGDELGDARTQRLVERRYLERDDLALLLDAGEVQVKMQTASLESLRELTALVRGEDHDRTLAGDDRAELGNGHLILGEDLE